MIKTENIIVRGVQAVRTYSDAGMMIRQVETGNLYSDAVDVVPCRYSYEETDTPVPTDVAPTTESEYIGYLKQLGVDVDGTT